MAFKKIVKRTMIGVGIGAGLLVLVVFVFMQQRIFGKAPSEKRVTAYSKLPNFKDGKFQNRTFTPDLAEGYSMSSVAIAQFFKKSPRRNPIDGIPSVKSDLLKLPVDSNVLVWFGHSSYFIQIDGKKILVDPVFSGNASPIPGTVESFKGTDRYTVNDLPTIDYLFISHDHYDHLDYKTILELKNKVGKVICGLGVGEHFEHWGWDTNTIIEKNWNESETLGAGFVAYCEPTRHFSGRGFAKNNTLWASYVLQTPTMKIYIGGDSGYDTHFAEIGKKHGEIDLAILENGQYDLAWHYIHLLPSEVLQAAKDLHAKRVFPVHSSKFVLANHPWDEPLQKISDLNIQSNVSLVTPLIGEIVSLSETPQSFKKWWVGVK